MAERRCCDTNLINEALELARPECDTEELHGEIGNLVGFVEIEVPTDGAWHPVTVRVADLLANRNPGEAPLDLNNIQNLFVLESTGPAHVWLDNIRLQCAFNTEPEVWQPDKTCDLRPRTPGRFVDPSSTPITNPTGSPSSPWPVASRPALAGTAFFLINQQLRILLRRRPETQRDCGFCYSAARQ